MEGKTRFINIIDISPNETFTATLNRLYYIHKQWCQLIYLTCFTVCSSVSCSASTGVGVESIGTCSSILTRRGSTLIDV